MCSQADHRLNRKCHAGLRGAYCFVLGVVRNVGRPVEELVDTMPTICGDDAAILTLCVLLNHFSGISECHAWFD